MVKWWPDPGQQSVSFTEWKALESTGRTMQQGGNEEARDDLSLESRFGLLGFPLGGEPGPGQRETPNWLEALASCRASRDSWYVLPGRSGSLSFLVTIYFQM